MSRPQLQTVSAIPETPLQIFERTRTRELQLSRLLIFFISGGLLFMLLPGTFLGVWNLISISGRRAADSISPAWIQAHGHAQVLGWIGSFILGIGFYSIPKLRGGLKPFALWSAWLSGAIWMAGRPAALAGECLSLALAQCFCQFLPDWNWQPSLSSFARCRNINRRTAVNPSWKPGSWL